MEQGTPRASVVVPTRGGAARLPVLLDLLAAQTEPDFEVVVVVDGDVDGSADVLASRAVDPRVVVEVLPTNRGRAVALNTGFDRARGEVLIRCDDDLEPAPHFVARHLAAHEASDVGVVGLYRNVFPDTAYARAYGRTADALFRRQAYAADPGTWWRYWAGNASVTRAVFDEVGPYDSGYRAYGWEDVDWGYRLHRSGRPVLLDPGLETAHRLAATTTRSRALRAYYSGAARLTFEARHGSDVLRAPSPGGPWGALVRGSAQVLTQERLEVAAGVVDRSLTALPPTVGHKAVALLVEAGYLAGGRIASVSDAEAV